MNKMANELAYATTVLRGTTSLTSNLKLENEDVLEGKWNISRNYVENRTS